MGLFNALLTILFLSTSCAYKLGYSGRKLSGGHKDIFISSFKNKTQEVGAELYFTNALVHEFYRSKIAQITKKSKASAWIHGTIKSIQFVPTTQNKILDGSVILNTEYRVLITVGLALVDASSKKNIWQNEFVGEKVYSAPQVTHLGVSSVNPNYDDSKRNEIFQVIAYELMSKVHDRMVERF